MDKAAVPGEVKEEVTSAATPRSAGAFAEDNNTEETEKQAENNVKLSSKERAKKTKEEKNGRRLKLS